MKTSFASLLIALCFYTLSTNAQNDSVYSYTLPTVSILQNVNGKDVVYEFEKNYNSFLLADSFLVADVNKFNYRVNINNLKKITTIGKNTSAPGVMGASFGFGFLIGALLAGANFGGGNSVTGAERVLVGLGTGTVLAIIGGSITVLFSHDNSYNIDKKDYRLRKKQVKEILNKIKK
jgi:hypothetical protein